MSATTPNVSRASRSVQAGRVVGGRYTLITRIAKGGMGEVWRARDRRTGMMVAAKVLRPELTGEEISLSRLRLEAKNTMKARHPNIAMVLDSGEDGGQGWLVMELIEGRPLTDYVGEGKRLRAEELVPILAQTSYALDGAAQAGIVHRDIKPANIMVRPDGMVKLTDFGISYAHGQANLTAVGMVMGTAQYLAPEQALGAEATPAGDLYSLGVIAYEGLAGHRPFTGKSAVDIAMAHVKEEVPDLPGDVPGPIADVVYGMLAKDPADRPSSGTALVRALTQAASRMGFSTQPRPLGEPRASEEAVPEPPQTPESALAVEDMVPARAPEAVSTQHEDTAASSTTPAKPIPQSSVQAPETASSVKVEYKWRPLAATNPDNPPSRRQPVAPKSRRNEHDTKPNNDPTSTGSESVMESKLGMWIITALVVLTIVLIIIAIIRDDGSSSSAPILEPIQVTAASNTEVEEWLNPALGS